MWQHKVDDINFVVEKPMRLTLNDVVTAEDRCSPLAEIHGVKMEQVLLPKKGHRVVTSDGKMVLSSSYNEENSELMVGMDFVFLGRLAKRYGGDGRQLRRCVMEQLASWPCLDFVDPAPTSSITKGSTRKWEVVLHPFEKGSANSIFQIQSLAHGEDGGAHFKRFRLRFKGEKSRDQFRIVLQCRPNFYVIASSESVEDCFDLFTCLCRNGLGYTGQTQQQWDAMEGVVLGKISELLRNQKVALGVGEAPVQLRAMSDKNLNEALAKLKTHNLPPDHPLNKQAALVYNEAAVRELKKMEKRWDSLRAESMTVTIVIDNKYFGLMEALPLWGKDEFMEQLGQQFSSTFSPSFVEDNLFLEDERNVFAVRPTMRFVTQKKIDNLILETALPASPSTEKSSAMPRPTFMPVAASVSRARKLSKSDRLLSSLQSFSNSLPVNSNNNNANSSNNNSNNQANDQATNPTHFEVNTLASSSSNSPPPPPPPLATSAPPPPPPAVSLAPIFPKIPLVLRRIPGVVITNCPQEKSIWNEKLKEIQKLNIGVQDWKFAFDASKKEKQVSSSDGAVPFQSVPSFEDRPSLLGINRERIFVISLRGMAMNGIDNLSLLISWVCTGQFPDEEMKSFLCDMVDQLMQLTPTEAEVRLFEETPRSEGEILAETFVRLIIHAGVDKWNEGLCTMALWANGSELLQKAEGHLVHLINAIKVLESESFFSLISPVAALILQLENSPSCLIRLPRAIEAVLERKTVGLLDGEQVSILKWMFKLNLFPQPALKKIDQVDVLHLESAADSDFSGLEELSSLVSHARAADEMVASTKAHLLDLRKTSQRSERQLSALLLKFDPRPGKLLSEELFLSVARFLKALLVLRGEAETPQVKAREPSGPQKTNN